MDTGWYFICFRQSAPMLYVGVWSLSFAVGTDRRNFLPSWNLSMLYDMTGNVATSRSLICSPKQFWNAFVSERERLHKYNRTRGNVSSQCVLFSAKKMFLTHIQGLLFPPTLRSILWWVGFAYFTTCVCLYLCMDANTIFRCVRHSSECLDTWCWGICIGNIFRHLYQFNVIPCFSVDTSAAHVYIVKKIDKYCYYSSSQNLLRSWKIVRTLTEPVMFLENCMKSYINREMPAVLSNGNLISLRRVSKIKGCACF